MPHAISVNKLKQNGVKFDAPNYWFIALFVDFDHPKYFCPNEKPNPVRKAGIEEIYLKKIMTGSLEILISSYTFYHFPVHIILKKQRSEINVFY